VVVRGIRCGGVRSALLPRDVSLSPSGLVSLFHAASALVIWPSELRSVALIPCLLPFVQHGRTRHAVLTLGCTGL
jgi:hypothetical protein